MTHVQQCAVYQLPVNGQLPNCTYVCRQYTTTLLHDVDVCANNDPNISNSVAVHAHGYTVYMHVCLCVRVCVSVHTRLCNYTLFECKYIHRQNVIQS